MRVVIESPLKGATAEEFQRNFRYLLWCCRAEYERGNEPIASHLVCCWFMDDTNDAERNAGIGWSWMWNPEIQHCFYQDLVLSSGMVFSEQRCRKERIPFCARTLPAHMLEAFNRGEWPKHTPGFEMAERAVA